MSRTCRFFSVSVHMLRTIFCMQFGKLRVLHNQIASTDTDLISNLIWYYDACLDQNLNLKKGNLLNTIQLGWGFPPQKKTIFMLALHNGNNNHCCKKNPGMLINKRCGFSLPLACHAKEWAPMEAFHMTSSQVRITLRTKLYV